MAYRVDISLPALSDAENAYLRIKEESPEKAVQWYKGLLEAVYSLENFPNRCPIAPEARAFVIEIRQLLYGKRKRQYRILFGISVDEQTGEDLVLIYRIRHSVQNYLEDLEILGESEDKEETSS
jgi:plasmid stabilization system protein ParE